MPTDPVVRQQVLKRLGGVTPQALSQRVHRIKKQFGPMSTEDAVYVIAHQNGIDISRRLDAETVQRVNRHVSGGGRSGPTGDRRAPHGTKKAAIVTIAGIGVDRVPGMTAAHARDAERMAKRVYPVLYVFENSLRDVINSVLTVKVGVDWFDKLAPKRLKEKVTDRRKAEGADAWHSKRGLHELHYLDLRDLATIVKGQKAWLHFKELLPRENWLDGVIDDMNVSRRPAAHMNPLSGDDIKQIEAGFARWARQMKAHKDLIP